MNENYLGGLLFPAVAGLFFFLNKPKVEDTETVEHIVYSRDINGLTGVERYLENQQNNSLKNESLGLAEGNISSVVVSGVTKYLQNRDQFPITGVTKYALRMSLAQKQEKQKANLVAETGVAKYIKNKGDAPIISGVAKYLKQQERLPKASKVAKYMAKKALAEKLASSSLSYAEETGVAKYLKYQESLPQPSKVSRYMTKQALLAKKEEQIVVKFETTGVSRYLKHQEDRPQISKVAKYMARQVMASKQKSPMPVVIETSVDRYMRSQS